MRDKESEQIKRPAEQAALIKELLIKFEELRGFLWHKQENKKDWGR